MLTFHFHCHSSLGRFTSRGDDVTYARSGQIESNNIGHIGLSSKVFELDTLLARINKSSYRSFNNGVM